MKKTFIILFALLGLSAGMVNAQDKVVKKVIELGTTDNQTMVHEDFLANVIGGRVVGSHNLQDAEKWVAEQFKSWGLEVVVQEVGEINVGFSRGPWFGKIVSGEGTTLHFGTPSYTAGTRGPQRGHVVAEPLTQSDFDRRKSTFKGAWVLVGGNSNGFPIDWSEAGDAKRAEIIAKNAEIDAQNREIRMYNMEHQDAPKEMLKMEEAPALFYRQMVEAGALGFIQAADVPMQIHYDRANCYNITMDNLPKVCDIKLDRQQYDYIMAKVKRMEKVELEFDIRNHFFEGPVKYHNVLGIIRGSKYPKEFVISGGHLDAFDSATGAVDDGQGVTVNMESARLLALSGAKPLRSIMFAIWTGEEYGLLGSKFFVESGMVPMDKVSNYFNRDGGPEVAVGMTATPAMYDDIVKATQHINGINPDFPFEVVKNTSEPRPRPTKAGGSDHAYFAMNGVPTVSLNLKDVKGYNFNYREIWHTDKDLYNMVFPDYLEHSAIVNALAIYGVANLPNMLSREGLYKD